MIAEILAVGTELLLGDVHDTNSTYLSQQLAQMGISVCHRQTVGDNPARLRAAIRLALSRADVVILCGGLGPTPDDLTKECACEELGVPLVLHEESLSRIRGYFGRSGRVMSDNNRKQAMMPEGGVFNTILSWFGLPPSGWYMAQESALASLIFIALWHGLGYGVLIAISGLRAIPDYVYEAARLDKSSKTTTMMKITMPLLSPTIFYLLITTCVGAFTTYDIVDLMTQGGPNNATMMLTYYIYEQGIRFMHYGRAMAAAVILMIICSSLTLLSFKASAKKIHYQ